MIMKLEYQKVGNYSLLLLSESEGKPLWRWGRMQRDYLREHCPALFNQLIMAGELWKHLNAVDDEADARMDRLIEQMKQAVHRVNVRDRNGTGRNVQGFRHGGCQISFGVRSSDSYCAIRTSAELDEIQTAGKAECV